MKRSYAVAWCDGEHTGSGRLEVGADRLELVGRDDRFSIHLSELADVSIARHPADRLHGLPALVLRPRDGAKLRIASLEGAGVLQELARHVERAGLTVAA
ncbi:MAG TPA: hypothetical protein VFL66_09290 [Gaiellaceae bacterium]|nr:hypothetical protein [Gaiellaceae bacterium]